MHSLGLLG